MPSNSVSNSDQEDTFATIVEGGKAYGDRIAAWMKAKAEHDAAFAKLQIGRATKNMLTEATNARDAAEKTLADARTKADAIVAEAMTKASGIAQHGEDRLKVALANAEEANKQAHDARNSAAKYASDKKVEADQKLFEANALVASNTKKAKELTTAKQAADRAQAEAEVARNTFLRKHQEASDFHKQLWG